MIEYYVSYAKVGSRIAKTKVFSLESERDKWVAELLREGRFRIVRQGRFLYEDDAVEMTPGKRYPTEEWEGSTDAKLMGIRTY